jgi:hypothetical protein
MLFIMAIVFFRRYQIEHLLLSMWFARGSHLYNVEGDNVENVHLLKIHNMERQAHEFDLCSDTNTVLEPKIEKVLL